MTSRIILVVAILTTAAAAPAAPALTTDYLVGKWSAFEEDCSHTIEFRKDGTLTTPIGVAKWTVSGDKVTMDYHDASEPTVSRIKPLSADRIAVETASGRKETEKRCK
jgi:hypothetical protein